LIPISYELFYIRISLRHLQTIARQLNDQMIVIYDPIPFGKVVQKISVGNYEPFTGI